MGYQGVRPSVPLWIRNDICPISDGLRTSSPPVWARGGEELNRRDSNMSTFLPFLPSSEAGERRRSIWAGSSVLGRVESLFCVGGEDPTAAKCESPAFLLRHRRCNPSLPPPPVFKRRKTVAEEKKRRRGQKRPPFSPSPLPLF